jgi:hypothetical protein
MKKMISTWMIGTAICLFSISSFAQSEKQETPRWVSDKGYWVVENNVKDPFNHIIRFYTNGDVMIYKETLTGVRLNTNRTKVKMKLKKVLETSAIAWEQKKVSEEEKQYLSAILK